MRVPFVFCMHMCVYMYTYVCVAGRGGGAWEPGFPVLLTIRSRETLANCQGVHRKISDFFARSAYGKQITVKSQIFLHKTKSSAISTS